MNSADRREVAEIVAEVLEQRGAIPRPQQQPNRPSRPTSSGGSFGFEKKADALGGAFGELTGVINRAGGSLSEFATDISSATGRIIPGMDKLGGVMGGALGYLENTQTVFQNLSKVGAGFNGDLGALRAGAAATRMPLDAFANMVGRNADAIAGLGAGVNQGAKRFSELSRAMFEDGQIIQGMMNLGYTIEESNAALLDNAELLGRQRVLQGMNDKEVAQATLQMAQDMALVAEITGESAEKQRQELIDANRDGRNIAALRDLEAKGITNAQMGFNTAFQGLQGMGDGAQAYLQDMIRGQGPMSEMTENFAAMNPQTAAIIREMAKITKMPLDDAEKQRRIRAVADRAQASANKEYTNQTNRTAAMLSDVTGSIGSSQADLIGQTEVSRRAVLNQQAEMEKALGRSVTEEEARLALQQKIRDNLAAQRGGNADGQDISRELNTATIGLANSASSVNNTIARNMSANTKFIELATTTLRGFTTVSGAIATGANTIVNSGNELAGTSVNETLLENSNFTELFKPIVTQTGLNTNITNITELYDEIVKAQTKIPGKALGGPVSANQAYMVGEEGPELFMSKMAGNIIPNDFFSTGTKNIKNAVSRFEQQLSATNPDPSEMINEMRSSLQKAAPSMSTEKMEQLLDSLNQSMLALLRINTTQTKLSRNTVSAISGSSNLMNGVAIR